MLPASVQGLGLGRPMNRRSLNGNYRSVATSPRADELFRQNIKNKWLRALVLTLTNPKLWYVLTGLLGSAWIVMSLFYVPSLLLMGDYSDLSEGPHILSNKTNNKLIALGHDIDAALDSFLRDLNVKFTAMGDDDEPPDVKDIWRAYTESVELCMLPFDRQTKLNEGLFPVQDDRSIFISLISYGNDYCPTMLTDMYSKARDPNKIVVGLIEEKFENDNNHNETSGDEEVGSQDDDDQNSNLQDNDDDDEDEDVSKLSCYDRFCTSVFGKPYCDKKAIRMLQLDEKEWLGHSVARYLGAKLWRGENFFLQADSNFVWLQNWDEYLIKDICETPTYPKSVLSYNPHVVEGLSSQSEEVVMPERICGAKFPEEQFPIAGIDSDIIQLDVNNEENHNKKSEDGKPCPAALLKSDFFFANGAMLSTLPFDPFVPWLSIGEETVLSLRMWTWEFDFYGPTKSVVGYNFDRDHPSRANERRKIWEASGHLLNGEEYYFTVTMEIANRPKHIIGYYESSEAMVKVSDIPSVLTYQDEFYGAGPARTISDFLAVTGIDPVGKTTNEATWCSECMLPF